MQSIIREGQLDIYQVAARTGEMEESIVAGIQYLAARGLISFNNYSPGTYIIKLNDGTQGG